MTTRWHIGAKQLRGAIASYAKRFDLLEVRVAPPGPPPMLRSGEKPRVHAKGEPPEDAGPNLATLRRWRKSVPPHFHFAVVAGPQLSRVRASDDAERLYARHGWQLCGEIPNYALMPDGKPCATTILFKSLRD